MLELYLLNAICRITNSNYPRTAEKIFLIAIKGKRKILLMEISTTDVIRTTVRYLAKEGPLSSQSVITTVLPQSA